jgi:hypothetical protein
VIDQDRCRVNPLRFRFAFRHAPPTAAPREILAQLLALFGSHTLPILPHAPSPAPVAAPAADSADEDSSEGQQAECLPETQHWTAKESRYQPIPKSHHHNAGRSEQRSDADYDQDCFRKSR